MSVEKKTSWAIGAARKHAEKGLCNGLACVRPSICPTDQQQQQRPVGLLLSALRTGDIDRQPRALCHRRRRSAANAGSVLLRADGGGSTQTRL